jgi:putative intracellular protease/amidase
MIKYDSLAEYENENMKILMILTSHDQLGDTGHKTGFWLEEFASPYYAFIDAGAEVLLASPKGGQPPIDPKSNEEISQTGATVRFRDDAQGLQLLANTHTLDSLQAEDFDAIFYPGGHGPLWDLAENKQSIALIEAFYAAGKPVGAVCHAPAVLRHANNEQGEALVKGKQVTGFSNSEERAVQLTDVVPFLVEDMLRANGGTYSKGDDWVSYSVSDGHLFTGQNPASSEAVASNIIAHLN